MPENKSKPIKQVFFSYGHDDNREMVDKLLADLKLNGYRVWIDYKEIGTWEDWRAEITEGILNSDLAISYLSAHSVRDDGVCLNEIALLLDSGKKVYPVLLEPEKECTPPASLSYLQYVNLSNWREKIKDKEEFDKWYKEQLKIILEKLESGKDFSDRISILRQVLEPEDFTTDIARQINNFVGRDWAFEELENWLKTDSRFLWITGEPGFGKTAIAANLIHKRSSKVIASWFCSYKSKNRKDPLIAIKTIAYQIAYRVPEYLIKLMNTLNLYSSMSYGEIADNKKNLNTKYCNPYDLFNLLFSNITNSIPLNEKLCVVIDGIDEATDENNNNEIAKLISDDFLELPNSNWLEFVFTSRPDASVVKYFQGLKNYQLDIHEKENKDDLKLYLENEFKKLKEKNINIDNEEDKIKLLIEKSEGIILYLTMVIKGVGEETFDLNDINAMPQGLFKLYNEQFEGRLKKNYKTDIKPIFEFLIASLGPIPEPLIKNIIKSYDKTESQFNEGINLLGSYITKNNDMLSIFHKSLTDFLTNSKDINIKIYDENIEEAKKKTSRILI